MASWLRSVAKMPLPPRRERAAAPEGGGDAAAASTSSSSSSWWSWSVVRPGKDDVLVHYYGTIDHARRTFSSDSPAAMHETALQQTYGAGGFVPGNPRKGDALPCAHMRIGDLPQWSPANPATDFGPDRQRPLRVVIISDTHEFHATMLLPPGDVLIHCGDVLTTDRWSVGAVSNYNIRHFFRWFNAQPFALRVVIGGNHDAQFQKLGKDAVRRMAAPAVYLEDELLDVCGLRIYGSPRSGGSSPNKAFQEDSRWGILTLPETALKLTYTTRDAAPDAVGTAARSAAFDRSGDVPQGGRSQVALSCSHWSLQMVPRAALRDSNRVDILMTHGATDSKRIVESLVAFKPTMMHCCGHVHDMHGVREVALPGGPAAGSVVSVVGCVVRGKPMREWLVEPVVIDVV